MGNDVIAATKFLLSSKKEELDLFCITSKTKKKTIEPEENFTDNKCLLNIRIF